MEDIAERMIIGFSIIEKECVSAMKRASNCLPYSCLAPCEQINFEGSTLGCHKAEGL